MAVRILTAAESRLVFGLANMRQNAEFFSNITAGIDRDYRDSGFDCCLNRRPERIGIRVLLSKFAR